LQTAIFEEDINGIIHNKIRMELVKDSYNKTELPSVISEVTTYTKLPSTGDAQALAKKYLTDTLQHCEQVAKVMQYFAHKL
jgi:hypothetical protein